MKTQYLLGAPGFDPRTDHTAQAITAIRERLADGPAIRRELVDLCPLPMTKRAANSFISSLVENGSILTAPGQGRKPIEFAMYDQLISRNRELLQLNEGLAASQLSRDEFITLWALIRDRLGNLFDNDDLCLEHQQERYGELLSVYRRVQVLIDGLELHQETS